MLNNLIWNFFQILQIFVNDEFENNLSSTLSGATTPYLEKNYVLKEIKKYINLVRESVWRDYLKFKNTIRISAIDTFKCVYR